MKDNHIVIVVSDEWENARAQKGYWTMAMNTKSITTVEDFEHGLTEITLHDGRVFYVLEGFKPFCARLKIDLSDDGYRDNDDDDDDDDDDDPTDPTDLGLITLEDLEAMCKHVE